MFRSKGRRNEKDLAMTFFNGLPLYYPDCTEWTDIWTSPNGRNGFYFNDTANGLKEIFHRYCLFRRSKKINVITIRWHKASDVHIAAKVLHDEIFSRTKEPRVNIVDWRTLQWTGYPMDFKTFLWGRNFIQIYSPKDWTGGKELCLELNNPD